MAEPEQKDIVTEIDETIARLAKQPNANPVQELVHTVLPLLRDAVMALGEEVEDLRDLVDPIKISGAEAQETVTILQSVLAANPDNAELKARVEALLPAFLPDDDGEEGDEGDGDEGDDQAH